MPLKSAPLTTGDALVHQDFDLDASVLGSPGLGLIRRRCSVFTHRARRYDMPNRHITLLHQESDHRFCAVLAQLCVHGSGAGRVGVAGHLNDVSFEAGGGLRQLFELLLVEFCQNLGRKPADVRGTDKSTWVGGLDPDPCEVYVNQITLTVNPETPEGSIDPLQKEQRN